MKKFLLLSLLALGSLAASAVTVNFDGTCASGEMNNPPEGWTVTGDGNYYTNSDGSVHGTQPGIGYSYLITPMVNGTISFEYLNDEGDGWYSYGGEIDVYKMTRNENGTFTAGDNLFSNAVEGTSFSTGTINVPGTAYIGFRLSGSCLKNVTYTTGNPDDPNLTDLTISSPSWVPASTTYLSTDANGNVAFSFSIEAQNTGNKTLTVGDEGYTFTLYESSAGDIVTLTPTENLAAGETKTMTFTGTFPLTAISDVKTLPDSKKYWCGFRLRQNVTGTTVSLAWLDLYPYDLACNFTRQGSSAEISELNFGFVSENTPDQICTLRNLSYRPATVTAINVPDGFSVDVTAPFTLDGAVEPNDTKDITVSVGDNVAGILSGDLEFIIDGLAEPVKLGLSAVNPIGDEYYADFETEASTNGWILNSSLVRNEIDESVLGAGNHYALENTVVEDREAITPKLHADAGDKLFFQAGSRSTSSRDAYVEVYYSPNRSDWELVKTIRNANYATDEQEPFGPALGVYGHNYESEMRTYTVNLPEGDGYLKFIISYARIDNVYGGHLVAVDHDLLFATQSVPAKGMVNNTYNAQVTVHNVSVNAEAAGSYAVNLVVDGQTVATAEETPAIAAGADQAFALSFTPHAAGTFPALVEYRAGEYVLATVPVDLVVAEESATGEITVGAGTYVQGGYAGKTAPFRFYDKNSRSMVLYTEEYLTANGIAPGTTITGLSYFGCFPERSDTHGPVYVWIASTDKTALTPDDGYALEALMNDDNRYFFSNDYYSAFTESGVTDGKIFEMPFDKPFVYNGGNIVISCENNFEYYNSSTGFVLDSSLASRAIIKSQDNLSQFATKTYDQCDGLPVTTFYYALTPKSYSGTVTNSTNNQPIADATVTLTSGDVIYSGTSDAAGAFTVNVIKGDMVYNVTASAANFNDFIGETPVSFADGNVVAEIQLTPSNGSGIAGVNADKGNVRITEREIIVEGIDNAVLSVFASNGTLCAKAEGNRVSIESLTPGVYVLNVANDGGIATVKFIKK